MARGNIVGINRRNGLFVVRDESGQLVVFELMDSVDLEIDDEVIGDLYVLGGHELRHVRSGATMAVYGQSGVCTLAHARAVLGG